MLRKSPPPPLQRSPSLRKEARTDQVILKTTQAVMMSTGPEAHLQLKEVDEKAVLRAPEQKVWLSGMKGSVVEIFRQFGQQTRKTLLEMGRSKS